ncbi:glycosyltransferase family 4 protein [Vagococcus sp. BWB3-3]|uniref:Glycosyltransferase family 4 protein n=1 Tax=Vagococcus allomyrinae TaxID=2794353 RepID=A0A940SXT1_9ENTE|nr:glycosyltransferase family 4 protein [Vagococcus allomyrinae]MBP1043646.1 glycosyltransferase family 4 protein [Vagococcus allomyrinae]
MEKMKKRILIVTEGYFPAENYGGPPVSVRNLCNNLKDEFDFFIIAKAHDLNSKEKLSGIVEGWNTRDEAKVTYLSNDSFKSSSFNKIIKEVKPDLIYLQSFFSYTYVPQMLRISKKNDIKTLIAPRGELLEGAYRKKWKKLPYKNILKWLYIDEKVFFHATSENEINSIKSAFGNKNTILSFPNLPSGKFDKNIEKDVKKKDSGKLSLVFISRIVPKKNLIYALEILREIKGDVIFDIFGPTEDKLYWEKCQKAIKELPPNIVVNYKGILKNEEVKSRLSNYHFLLFPTLSENYGHVIVEAMLASCPVILSDQTPWNKIVEYEGGFVFPLKNKSMFIEVVQNLVLIDDNVYKNIEKNNEKFILNEIISNEEIIHQKYLFRELIKK